MVNGSLAAVRDFHDVARYTSLKTYDEFCQHAVVCVANQRLSTVSCVQAKTKHQVPPQASHANIRAAIATQSNQTPPCTTFHRRVNTQPLAIQVDRSRIMTTTPKPHQWRREISAFFIRAKSQQLSGVPFLSYHCSGQVLTWTFGQPLNYQTVLQCSCEPNIDLRRKYPGLQRMVEA